MYQLTAMLPSLSVCVHGCGFVHGIVDVHSHSCCRSHGDVFAETDTDDQRCHGTRFVLGTVAATFRTGPVHGDTASPSARVSGTARIPFDVAAARPSPPGRPPDEPARVRSLPLLR